jgi:hypothetical protein
VQIAESVDGRRRIVRHVGSARDEAELGMLLEQARDLLDDDLQGVLDLGMQVPQRVARMIPAPGPLALFTPPPPSSMSSSTSSTRTSRARVIRTSSRIVYDVLAGVFDDLGFAEAVNDEGFRDLVIARIVEPTSLLDVDRVLGDLSRVAASLSTRKRTLRRAGPAQATGSSGESDGYRDRIAAACCTHAAASGDVSLVLYDVTTLYFEAEKEDDGADGLRKVGFSKERRVDPQIVVGLLVDRTGFPLEIGCYQGNKAETLTIVPIVKQFQEHHHLSGGLEGMVVVADAGMLSAGNLKDLDAAGVGFIVGSRQTRAPLDLESHYRWHGEVFTDAQVIDTITPRHGGSRRAARPNNDPGLKAEPVWTATDHPTSWRAVWAYSQKRFVRDNRTLTAQENRARAVVEGEQSARTPRFVKTNGDARTLDEAALSRARQVAGLKGYVTNLDATTMPAPEVIASYHDLWHVEQSFRMSKTDLAARPMFARTRDAIEAH